MVEKSRSLDMAATIVLTIGVLYILGPLYLTLATASHSYEFMLRHGISLWPGDHLLDNMVRIFTETNIPRQTLNSLVVAILVAIGTCVFSFLTAFAIVYFQIRYATLIFAVVLATVLLPVEIRVLTTYQVAADVLAPIDALLDGTGLKGVIEAWFGAPVHLELSVLDTHVGLALPLVAHGTGTFLFRQFFRTLPRDLAKAARMDGAGPVRFMIDVLLPLSMPSFAALFILTFLSGWTQYLWPLVASSTPGTQTAVVGLARLVPDADGTIPDFPLIMAGAVVVSIIPLVMITVLQRYLVRGLVLSEK